MKKFIYLPVLFTLLTAAPLPAQEEAPNVTGVESKDLLLKISEDTLKLKYLEIGDSSSLRQLGFLLRRENYPVAVIQKQPAEEIIDLLTEYDALVKQYEKMKQTYQEIDSLNRLSEARLKDVISLERARADNFRDVNQQLQSETRRLNEQLNLTSEVANNSLRGRLRKNTSIAILGGVIGLSAGLTIALIAN